MFLPCYLFVIIPAPYFRRFADNPRVKAFVDGVTAAATGAIAGAAFVLGRRAMVDLTTVAIAAATWLTFVRFKKVPEPLVILAAGLAGLHPGPRYLTSTISYMLLPSFSIGW